MKVLFTSKQSGNRYTIIISCSGPMQIKDCIWISIVSGTLSNNNYGYEDVGYLNGYFDWDNPNRQHMAPPLEVRGFCEETVKRYAKMKAFW